MEAGELERLTERHAQLLAVLDNMQDSFARHMAEVAGVPTIAQCAYFEGLLAEHRSVVDLLTAAETDLFNYFALER